MAGVRPTTGYDGDLDGSGGYVRHLGYDLGQGRRTDNCRDDAAKAYGRRSHVEVTAEESHVHPWRPDLGCELVRRWVEGGDQHQILQHAHPAFEFGQS